MATGVPTAAFSAMSPVGVQIKDGPASGVSSVPFVPLMTLGGGGSDAVVVVLCGVLVAVVFVLAFVCAVPPVAFPPVDVAVEPELAVVPDDDPVDVPPLVLLAVLSRDAPSKPLPV